MVDIVERLRDWPDYEPVKMFCGPEIVKDVREAAAEIERLRLQNERLESSIKYVCGLSARAGDLFNDYRGDQ